MKEKWCANFNSFISEKITLVPGDISCEDLGFKDFDLKEKIYDVAFGINTLEAMHVVNFAKKCFKLKVLVHVSTAYVSKKRRGLVLEKSVDGTSGLVIDVEKKVVGQGLNELIAEGASEKEIKLAMTHLVIKRAKMYGWPNSYVFTIGELLIQHLKESIYVDYNWQNTLCCQYLEGMPNGQSRKINFVMPLVEIYGPHLLSNATFDDRNTENLRMATRETGMEIAIFSFILSSLIGKITS
ncbi:hypothetical protein CICLE_v10024082mg [Citrus x clementina]|uniref:Fatty acyl-CoA reductase n=1 Tax=Citrus clementina TaxID=85681 RepID=V4T251_CITCL|nr:hypothetical protein CICLE_v10024082mg [Citrus x clementina]